MRNTKNNDNRILTEFLNWLEWLDHTNSSSIRSSIYPAQNSLNKFQHTIQIILYKSQHFPDKEKTSTPEFIKVVGEFKDIMMNMMGILAGELNGVVLKLANKKKP